MEMTLFTCGDGKWLYDNGESFIAWNEEEYQNHIDEDDDLYLIKVKDEDTIKIEEDGFIQYEILVTDDISFNRVF